MSFVTGEQTSVKLNHNSIALIRGNIFEYIVGKVLAIYYVANQQANQDKKQGTTHASEY